MYYIVCSIYLSISSSFILYNNFEVIQKISKFDEELLKDENKRKGYIFEITNKLRG